MKILIVCLIMVTNVCLAQSNEQGIEKCTESFRSVLTDPNKINEWEAQAEIRMKQLRDCLVSQPFPSFEVTTLSGKKIKKDDLIGKVVLLNLWFIGCSPCIAEMPLLNELNEEFKSQGFILLALSLDQKSQLEKFLTTEKLNFEIIENSRDVIEKTFKLGFGYPTNIFLNKKGEIVEYKTGGSMNEPGLSKTKEEFKQLIQSELKK